MRSNFFYALTALALIGFVLSTGMVDAQVALANGVLRLHVIANSDSADDQATKLKVRDAVLAYANAHMAETDDKPSIERFIADHLAELQGVCERTVREGGYSYRVRLELGRFAFPEKTYGDRTYPGGDYDALRIVLGDGAGQNWWCVIFPPLCLVDVGATAAETPADSGIEFKSLFADWFGGTK